MSKWFYYNESGEKIEVTGGQLKWLAKNGKIAPGTLVETEDGKKALAKKVVGLTFTAATQPETKVSKPATPETDSNNLAQSPSLKLTIDEHTFMATIQEEIEQITAAPLVEKNPFITSIPTEENLFLFTPSKPKRKRTVTPPITKDNGNSMVTATSSAMKAQMNWIGSAIGFVLVIALACVVVTLIWWLLGMGTTGVTRTEWFND